MAKKPKVSVDFYSRDKEEIIKEYLDFGPDDGLCWDDFVNNYSDEFTEFHINFPYESRLADWCSLQMTAIQMLPRALWDEFNIDSANVQLDYLEQDQDTINGNLLLNRTEGVKYLSTHRKYFDKMLAQHNKGVAAKELDTKSKLKSEMARITKELAKYAKAQKGKVSGSKTKS